jgi:hypothetical protein
MPNQIKGCSKACRVLDTGYSNARYIKNRTAKRICENVERCGLHFNPGPRRGKLRRCLPGVYRERFIKSSAFSGKEGDQL